MDLLALIVFLVLLGTALGLAAGGIVGYLREEWRRMRARTWAPGSGPGTMDDPRVAAMVARQRFYGRHLRKKGLSLLAGKPYVPVLTKPSEAEPQEQPDNVVPLRRARP